MNFGSADFFRPSGRKCKRKHSCDQKIKRNRWNQRKVYPNQTSVGEVGEDKKQYNWSDSHGVILRKRSDLPQQNDLNQATQNCQQTITHIEIPNSCDAGWRRLWQWEMGRD